MVETLVFALLIFLFLNRTKGRRKPRGLDTELKELIENSNERQRRTSRYRNTRKYRAHHCSAIKLGKTKLITATFDL